MFRKKADPAFKSIHEPSVHIRHLILCLLSVIGFGKFDNLICVILKGIWVVKLNFKFSPKTFKLFLKSKSKDPSL